MEKVITLGKLLSLWFCFFLHSIKFLISKTSYRTYKMISSNELARPIMGTIFLVINKYIHYHVVSASKDGNAGRDSNASKDSNAGKDSW